MESELIQPESIRHVLKLFPKREILRRIQNSESVLNKKYHSRLSLDTSLDSETTRKSREYSSIQNLIYENQKYTYEEIKQHADSDEKNNKISNEVDICMDRNNLEGTTFQNQMIELRDLLSESFLYNEEKINQEMDNLRNQLQNVIPNNIAAKKVNLDDDSQKTIIENIDDILEQTEYLITLNEKKKNMLLINSQNILNGIKIFDPILK